MVAATAADLRCPWLPLLQVMAEDRPLMYLANPENGKKVVSRESQGLLWRAVLCCAVSAQWRRC